MPLLLPSPGEKDARRTREFFEHVVPTLLRLRAADCRDAGGSYGFVLSGTDGGCWTIDFGALTVAPRLREATLVLRTTAAAFAAMLAGELDVAAAVADGTIRYDG